MKNKYEDLDKQVSKEIMSEFKGKHIEHVCQECNGSGCENCDGNGSYTIEY